MTAERKILIFENAHTLAEYLLKKWIEVAQAAIQQRGRFTVALSGGRSPMEFYCKLSALENFGLWQKTHIFLGDERFVPLDDEASNFKIIKASLLDYVNIPPENVHPIDTDQKNVDLAAQQYNNELVRFFEFKDNNLPVFDFMLLGIGTDGHTASLFPDDDQVNEAGRLVLPVSLGHLKNERISLTLPVINNSRNIIFLGLGTKKADILRKIIEEKQDLPASKVNPTNGRLTFLLDHEAAQQLSYQDAYRHEDQAISFSGSGSVDSG